MVTNQHNNDVAFCSTRAASAGSTQRYSASEIIALRSPLVSCVFPLNLRKATTPRHGVDSETLVYHFGRDWETIIAKFGQHFVRHCCLYEAYIFRFSYIYVTI